MSEVKVNKVSPRSGTNVQLGDSGDTITIPSGVTFDASSGGLAGTLTTAAQPNITSVGTLTSFSSTGIDDNATSTAITIDSNQNVGIGTASPSYDLDVVTNGSTADIRLHQDNDGGTTILRKSIGGTTGNNYIYFGDSTDSNAGMIRYNHTSDYLSVNVNASERMRIDSSGNVGIGTSSPSHKLDVNGQINVSNGITFSGALSTGTGIASSGTNGNLRLYSGGAQVVTVTSSRVGIGKSTPNAKLHVDDSGGGNVLITRTSTNQGIYFEADGTNATVRSTSPTGSLLFQTNGNNERMRIDSSGNVLFNTTGIPNGTSIYGSAFEATSRDRAELNMALSTTEDGIYMVRFYNPNGQIGHISTSGTSGISYNTSSDYRLKENVSYDFDATTRLKQLKPARFNFIADANTTVDGFLAHEISSVVPEAISGEKDATETKEKVVVNSNGQVIAKNIEQADWETGKIADEDGNTQYPTDSTWEATKVVPVYQGIDQSKLVPLLVKTIQELEARITQLENA
jgi:hypothetical protein